MLFIHDESATKQTALRRRNPKFIPVSINGLIGELRKQIPTARLAGLSPRVLGREVGPIRVRRATHNSRAAP